MNTHDLRTVLANQASTIDPATTRAPFEELHDRIATSRRRRTAALSAAVVVAVVAAVVGVAIWTGQNQDDDTGVPVDQDRSSRSGPPFFLDLFTGDQTPVPPQLQPETLVGHDLADTLLYSASRDGSRLAYFTCSDAGGPDSTNIPGQTPFDHGFCSRVDVLGVVNVDGSEMRFLESDLDTPTSTAGQWHLYGARWSPDGTKLVYQDRPGRTPISGTLIVEDLSTGERTQVVGDGDLACCIHEPYEWVLGADFSVDGESVLYHNWFEEGAEGAGLTRVGVFSVPVGGGDPTLVLTDAAFPMPFPDGRTIAFVERPKGDGPEGADGVYGRAISVATLDGGDRQRLVEAEEPIWHPALSPDGTRIAYQVAGVIHIVEVSSTESSEVTTGTQAVWLDDDTLLVTP